MPMCGQKFFIEGRAVSSMPQTEEPDQKAYVLHDVTQLSLESIRFRLCSLGPAKCAKCQLCAYGREYVRRIAAGEEQQRPPYKRTYAAKCERDKERRAQWRAAGLCAKCGKRPPAPGRVTCQACLNYNRKRKQAQREAGKFEKEGLQNGT